MSKQPKNTCQNNQEKNTSELNTREWLNLLIVTQDYEYLKKQDPSIRPQNMCRKISENLINIHTWIFGQKKIVMFLRNFG